MIIGSNYIFLENLPSSNSYVAEQLKRVRLPEGLIVYTNFQSNGRGQVGNSWESEDGKNLLMSTVLYPEIVQPDRQFYLSMSMSLGICDFIRRYITNCSIKWPNDIYVSNDKIAGLLIENSLIGNKIENAIIGIGLNINQIDFTSSAPNPVSLSKVTGKNYSLKDCLDQLAYNLDIRYKQLLSEDFGIIRKEYTELLYLINEWHAFEDEQEKYPGRIKGITDNGRLIIEKRDGSLKDYAFKEVSFHSSGQSSH